MAMIFFENKFLLFRNVITALLKVQKKKKKIVVIDAFM